MPTSKSYHPLWRSVIRPYVLLLDNWCCMVCGSFAFSNQVHHNDGETMTCNIAELFTLCPKHHMQVESNRFRLSGRDLDNQKFSKSDITHFERLMRDYVSKPHEPPLKKVD